MSNIKSLSANRIKEIVKLHQKKYRDEMGLFLVEGQKAVEELLDNNIEVKAVYAIETFKSAKIDYEIIDENTMKKISTTSSVCEVLAIAKKKENALSEMKQKNKLILLDSVSDPGNLGTIIRSSAAFGIEGIILYGDCVDLYSSKVIRSSAGNFFKVPIVAIKDIKQLKEVLNSFTKIATALSKENNIKISDVSKCAKYVVMFGSEANGLQKSLIDIADKNIKLKMQEGVESLNLAVSASIIMYELQ